MLLCQAVKTSPGAPRRTLKLLVGAHLVPHPDKKDGEDAFYASSRQTAPATRRGQAEGVDPGAFSRRLLAHAASSAPADEAVAIAREAVKDDALCKKAFVHSAGSDARRRYPFCLQPRRLGFDVLRPTPRKRGDVV